MRSSRPGGYGRGDVRQPIGPQSRPVRVSRRTRPWLIEAIKADKPSKLDCRQPVGGIRGLPSTNASWGAWAAGNAASDGRRALERTTGVCPLACNRNQGRWFGCVGDGSALGPGVKKTQPNSACPGPVWWEAMVTKAPDKAYSSGEARRPRVDMFEIRKRRPFRGRPPESLAIHLAGMHAKFPNRSVLILISPGLQVPEVTVWTVWQGRADWGGGALKELNDGAAS